MKKFFLYCILASCLGIVFNNLVKRKDPIYTQSESSRENSLNPRASHINDLPKINSIKSYDLQNKENCSFSNYTKLLLLTYPLIIPF